ncbi:glutamate-1-semialdehyde 2,1-aminomutase [Chlamydiifrater phoenicopteri]|uniref:glutamate-1-semialdehyde 2,1-aminomutase n=1 Tax=Chlamydiifrater phoenicopteri TaxID=2681469 RepID=UPI001BCE2809|nr:glutamate-1-semialdehyde 2,1-aminomutase [Chlamydiifrater phoenicopteri]
MSDLCPPLEKETQKYSFERALSVFPGGVNSPVRACKAVGVPPPVIAKAQGHTITSSEGQEFVDFCCSWGSLIHGHAYSGITSSVSESLSAGTSYGLTSVQEIQFAELILSSSEFSGCQMRFVSSGTEAAMTAIRLARGVTRRQIVVKFVGGYHGHADVLMKDSFIEDIVEGRVEKSFLWGDFPLLSVHYNDVDGLRTCMELFKDQVAAIIIEPIAANMGLILPSKEFVEEIAASCQKYGCLLIADEVVTGYRLKIGGFAEVLQWDPDIRIFGKIIGGGFPVAAVVAKKELMEYLAPQGQVFQAGTLSGNPVAMIAGRAAVQACMVPSFYSQLLAKTEVLIGPARSLIAEHSLPVQLVSEGSMFGFFFSESPVTNLEESSSCEIDKFVRFYKEVFDSGVYLSPSPFEVNFVSGAHDLSVLEVSSEKLCRALLKTFDL